MHVFETFSLIAAGTKIYQAIMEGPGAFFGYLQSGKLSIKPFYYLSLSLIIIRFIQQKI
jgi:hypothetical protein